MKTLTYKIYQIGGSERKELIDTAETWEERCNLLAEYSAAYRNTGYYVTATKRRSGPLKLS